MLRVRGCAARSTPLWMELGVIQFLTFHVRDHGVCIPLKLLLLPQQRSSQRRSAPFGLSCVRARFAI